MQQEFFFFFFALLTRATLRLSDIFLYATLLCIDLNVNEHLKGAIVPRYLNFQ